MRKRYRYYRTVIVVGPKYIKNVYNAMVMSYGQDRVICSMHPRDLFGLMRKMKPKLLIVEPEIFDAVGISAADINAYLNEMQFHTVTLYASEEAAKLRDKYKELKPKLEYVNPKEFLSMTYDIPVYCRRIYEKVKEPVQNRTRENFHNILQDCGFHCHTKGAPFMEEALFRLYFNPDLHQYGGATRIYRELAEKYETTPRIAERSMQRFLDDSMKPEVDQKLHEALDIPAYRSFEPLNFRNFTIIFNTYYTLKYGFPEVVLKTRHHS